MNTFEFIGSGTRQWLVKLRIMDAATATADVASIRPIPGALIPDREHEKKIYVRPFHYHTWSDD